MKLDNAGERKLEKGLPHSPGLLDIAHRLLWWLPPEEALDCPIRFLAQVMALGSWNQLRPEPARGLGQDFQLGRELAHGSVLRGSAGTSQIPKT